MDPGWQEAFKEAGGACSWPADNEACDEILNFWFHLLKGSCGRMYGEGTGGAMEAEDAFLPAMSKGDGARCAGALDVSGRN